MLDPNRHAVLYRMVMEEHVCPFGLKAKHLLESHGYTVEDNQLTSRAEVEAFKARHDVDSTPQTFIAGQLIGDYADLRSFFGMDGASEDKSKRYVPVACVFLTSGMLAAAVSWAAFGTSFTPMAGGWFVSIAMMLLAMLKLQDIEGFTTIFLGYDLLAQRFVPYAYAYPFLEWFAGALMTAHVLPWLSIPIALFIGAAGAVSVWDAVYVRKRKLECACVGAAAKVPLGAVAMGENLMMIAMAFWMLARVAAGA